MGEIADMMLDGTLCQSCGVYLEDSLPGFPQSCADCQKAEELNEMLASESRNVSCPTCGKRVRRIGLAQHQRDKHGSQLGK